MLKALFFVMLGWPLFGAVAIANHNANATCTNGSTSCTISVTTAGGHSIIGTIGFCGFFGCMGGGGCTTVTASDPTNGSYTLITAANLVTAGWEIFPFYIGNAASTSPVTLTFSISGGGCTFNFAQVYYVDCSGTNTSTPIDSAVSANGSGAVPFTMNSAGNVTGTGEMGLGWCDVSGTISWGTYTQVDAASVNDADANKTSLTQGSGTSFSCNGTGTAFASILAIQAAAAGGGSTGFSKRRKLQKLGEFIQ